MKVRKADVIKKGQTYTYSLTSIVILLLLIFIFKTVPKIFVSATENLHNLVSPFVLKKNEKILAGFLENQSSKDKPILIQNKDLQGILAKSYVIYDVKNNQLLAAKNEDSALPLASLTKVVTAITAVHLKNKNTLITIDSSKMRPDEYLDLGLKDGQVWKMGDLLRYGLTISSNSSMDIIASTLMSKNSDFIAEMNDYVKSLGFSHFEFATASGLDYGNTIGGRGTALEYAKLLAKAYELIPGILSYTIHSKINLESTKENIYAIPNTNREASESIGLLASKTGFTDAAGGNLAVLVNFGVSRPMVIVVLGSTLEGRFQDVDKLLTVLKKSL